MNKIGAAILWILCKLDLPVYCMKTLCETGKLICRSCGKEHH